MSSGWSPQLEPSTAQGIQVHREREVASPASSIFGGGRGGIRLSFWQSVGMWVCKGLRCEHTWASLPLDGPDGAFHTGQKPRCWELCSYRWLLLQDPVTVTT